MNVSVTDVDAIFAAAIELSSPDERTEYVRRVCGESAELRQRVNELLAAHFEAGDFLERPHATVLYRENEDLQAGPGTVIGPYKLLQQIGEGGMGVVFMAEQTEPIQRTVALKIIKAGMDTRQVIARFEAERQALAMMDHPNIAKVLDAGTTDTGRPYFVMELVKGIPITKYCDEKQLSICERLELVLPVCQAVQHAHQKGLIHRDLKPTNVLVSEYDNRAVPKVIDFGVAKATAQKLTERTMFTEFGQVIGTVEYMSPEQAKFNQLDIDTRSDIYSLGVLLYELLTGSTPFERERLREAAFDEVLRIIREEEPPKPSTRLSTSDTLPSIAANRHTEPARLSKDVSGELDWIVMKCLEKDRNRRYESANSLGRDIERYLKDEPVQACPPSSAYRFRKFARRNKVAMFGGTAAVAVLLVGVTGLAISNRLIAAQRAQAETERERTESERQRAEENLLRSRVAIRDILFEAALGRGKWAQLPEDLRKEFAAKTTDFYQSLLHEKGSSLSQQYDTAVGCRSLAVLHNSLKEFEKAVKFASQSIEILDRLAAEHPDVLEYRNQQAYSHYILGSTLVNVNRKDVAEPALERSATLYEALISERPDALGCYSELLGCYNALIRLAQDRGATKETEQTIQRVLALPAKVPPTPESSATLSLVADWLSNVGRLDEAIDAHRKAIELNPDNADAYVKLSGVLNNQGKYDESIAACRKAIELKPDDASAYVTLAVVFSNQGKYDESIAANRKAIELKPDNARAYDDLASDLSLQGKFQEVEALRRQEIEHAPSSRAYLGLGSALVMQGKRDEAVAAYRTAIEFDPKNGALYSSLGHSLDYMGQFDDAVSALRKAIELSPKDAGSLNKLAWMLATAVEPKNRDPRQAVELAKQAVELSSQDSSFWVTLGVAHYRAGEWQPAIDALEKSMTLPTASDFISWFFLAMVHHQLGDSGEARRSFDKGVESMDKVAHHYESLRRTGRLSAASIERTFSCRAEAAELLGISQPQPSTDSSDQSQSPKPSSP